MITYLYIAQGKRLYKLGEGTEQTSSEVAGIKQVKIMDIEAIIYSYSNKGGSNATFTFSGGSLQAKAQFGLK